MNKEKVFWSNSEKTKMISKAIDIQREKPELAGLPLLRAAMLTLPQSRRRRLVALSQVPWFEDAIKSEIKQRLTDDKDWSQEILPHHLVWSQMHEEWRREQIESIGKLEQVLNQIHQDHVKMIQLLKKALVTNKTMILGHVKK
jgi:hypothetical protein